MGNINGSHFVGIAGPSGSGKSVLAKRITEIFPGDSMVLSLDSYYRDLSDMDPGERDKQNFDIPDAIDDELLVAHLESLQVGDSIKQPIYDFCSHTRKADTQLVSPKGVMIVEGLFSLYWPKVRDLMKTKIFIEVDDNISLERRERRDVRDRGRSVESVHEQFRQTVQPMCHQYILPTKSFADVVVSGTDALDETLKIVISNIKGES